jgi:hypothetical protein
MANDSNLERAEDPSPSARRRPNGDPRGVRHAHVRVVGYRKAGTSPGERGHGTLRHPRTRQILFDCLALLAGSLVAEGAAFTTRLGRATISIDAAQYVAAAEALLDPEQTPHFEARKPGYPLFLAGVKLAFGRLGWVAIVCNHVMLLLLPLAAYGLGNHLHSRLLGWVSALLTMAHLQSTPFGDWMMSEALYALLLSFGLLAYLAGLRKRRAAAWLGIAGLTLGLAWLTRGVATV